MRLGQLVARPVDTPRRAVTAITLPCRAYAAVLVALGCVLSRDPLGFNPDALGDEELAAHFANLCALRPGTTVTVASGRIKRVGRFTGVDHSRGDFRTRRRSCLRPEASSVSSCSDLLALLERLARPSSSCLAGALLGRGRTPRGGDLRASAIWKLILRDPPVPPRSRPEEDQCWGIGSDAGGSRSPASSTGCPWAWSRSWAPEVRARGRRPGWR
jgi:hypothetical protein